MSFSSTMQTRVADHLRTLRKKGVKLQSNLLAFQAQQFGEPVKIAQKTVDQACKRLEATNVAVRTRLADLKSARRDAEQAARLFREEHKITRELKRPNLFATTALIFITGTTEALVTMFALSADGKMDVLPATAFAGVFAVANIAIGLLTGGVARFNNHRSECSIVKRGDKAIRRAAKLCVAACASLGAALIFTAGRVRATGEHDGIFTFDPLSFADTFQDSVGVAIMVFAFVSYVVSVVKGYSGIWDPIPGYSDAVGKSDQEILKSAEQIVDDGFDRIDETATSTAKELEELMARPDDADALIRALLAFNAEVDDAMSDLAVFLSREWEQHAILEGTDTPRPKADLSAFENLKFDVAELVTTSPGREALDRLHQAQGDAADNISSAFAEFTAHRSGGVVLTPFSTAAE